VSRLNKFAALSSQERRLFFRALFLVGAVRAGLWLLPFRVVRRLIGGSSQHAGTIGSVAQCVWAVRASSRFVPGATCLTQALTAQALLARSGYESRLEIGVTKDEAGRFRAHAWVVFAGAIVIGGAEADRYVPLTAWNRTMGRPHTS
jgi:Transglutaminase-like superfamily